MPAPNAAKRNWKYKRAINLLMHKLSRYPRVSRFLVRLMYLLRLGLRFGKLAEADPIGGVLVSDKYKIVFVGNPKVASSNMKNLFANEIGDSVAYRTLTLSAFVEQFPARHDYLYFCFVREPVERALSCWQDKISNHSSMADVFIMSRFKGLYPDMPFSHYVKWLNEAQGQDQFADRHWISQSRILACPSHIDLQVFELNSFNDAMSMLETKLKGVCLDKYKSTRHKKTKRRTDDIPADVVASLHQRYQDDYRRFEFTEAKSEPL